jgi:hypothetical protein
VIRLRYSLLSDGPTDDALLPVLTWLLRYLGVTRPIQAEWADLRYLPAQPQNLAQRIQVSVELYPCDLLFVHRDAEKEAASVRQSEIATAIAEAESIVKIPPIVPLVPIRMTEAWLLIEEQAIRRAASNPNGKIPLAMPKASRVEDDPDPKETMYELLRVASGLHGRRRKHFSTSGSARLVAGYISNFRPLFGIRAFKDLENQLSRVVIREGWV